MSDWADEIAQQVIGQCHIGAGATSEQIVAAALRDVRQKERERCQQIEIRLLIHADDEPETWLVNVDNLPLMGGWHKLRDGVHVRRIGDAQ